MYYNQQALISHHIAPKRLQEEYGFTFKFTDLPAALADLFDKTDVVKQNIAS
ncbi:MAG: DUF1731 domain-containing protein [Proteobacteria bacterium]|nr:DUF1731 domain-containing protein [Pseudomonadota bacterium]